MAKILPGLGAPLATPGAENSFLRNASAVKALGEMTANVTISMLERKQMEMYTNFIEFLAYNSNGQKFMKKSQCRSRLVAYLLNALIMGCSDTHKQEICLDPILNRCGTFDYEEEIMRDKWIVPLSGNLLNDAYCNFIARYAAKASIDDCITRIREITGCLIELRLNCIFSQFTEISLEPQHMKTESEYEAFLNRFVDSPTPKAQLKDKVDPRITEISAGYTGTGKGWNELFVHNIPFSCHSKDEFSYRPEIGIIDSRMVHPNKAWAGVKVLPCLYDSVKQLSSLKATLPSQNVHEFATTAYFAALYNRERQEWLNERNRIIKSRNLKKEMESKVSKLEKECDALNKRLEAKDSIDADIEIQRQRDAERDREIEKLKTQIHHLESKLEKTEKTLKTEQDKVFVERAKREALEQEVNTLQEMAENQETQTSDETSKTLDTSVFDNLKIVCFGGFRVWSLGMRDLHPNVTFYDRQSPMPDDTIATADVVWIQTNAISHPQYYKIINSARNRGVPVRFFSYAGHGACKQQLVEETKKMFPKN